jgi:hypothetical protein
MAQELQIYIELILLCVFFPPCLCLFMDYSDSYQLKPYSSIHEGLSQRLPFLEAFLDLLSEK